MNLQLNFIFFYCCFLKAECDQKMVKLEVRLTLASIEKQTLLDQKEMVVQQLTREKQTLQVIR